MRNTQQLNRFCELLQTADNATIRTECQALIADGVEHREIVHAILSKVTACSVADPSWLPAASVINLSDSLVHVALQNSENKHQLMVFGERRPEFRRIERPQVATGPVRELNTRFETASVGNDWQVAEQCLLGIAEQANIEAVFETVLSCLLQPRYLGATSGPWWAGVRHLSIGCQIDLWQEYGDDDVHEIVCYLGARQCARIVAAPDEKTAHAISVLSNSYRELNAVFGDDDRFDEAEFRSQVVSRDVTAAFRAVTNAWQLGVPVEKIDLALTMLCVERLLRGGCGADANWDNLKRELQATGVIRRAKRISDQLAYKAALHAVWQIVRHGNDGLADEIPDWTWHAIPDESEQIGSVINGIRGSQPQAAIHQVGNFMAGGHDPERLLREMILWVNQYCKGNAYYAGQRGMIDAWYLATNHPERNCVPMALAGWMADYRNQHFNHSKRYGPVWGANISDDGGLLAIRSGGTRVFDAVNGKELMFFRGEPCRFAFHPNSRLLACGWDDGQLQIIDLIAREVVRQWDAFPNDVSGQIGKSKLLGLAFSPNGRMLAGAARGCNKVRVWNTKTWEQQLELVGHSRNRVESVTFDDDSEVIATGGNDGTVRIWNANDGRQQLVYDGYNDAKGRTTGLQFHPDGCRIVSAECEGELRIWEWRTGKTLVSTKATGYCNFAGFTSDGRFMISEHAGTLHYWNAETGEQVDTVVAIRKVPDDHTIFGGVNQSHDRETILTAGWHGQVKLWTTDDRTQQHAFRIEIT